MPRDPQHLQFLLRYNLPTIVKICDLKLIGAPKTNARLASVPAVPALKTILQKYKANFPAGEGDWIFRGEKLMRPLDLDNLSRRDIPPRHTAIY
jgi:hypothetical protein